MLKRIASTVALALAFVFTAGMCCADAPAPMDILRHALKAQEGVKDYTAMVTVDAKIPDSHIPVRTAKVYVKRPDKVYVESEGIVFLPKRALLFGDLAKELDKEADASLVGNKPLGDDTLYCVKLIPKKDGGRPGNAPRFLAWVRSGRWTVERVQVTSGGEVAANVKFTYRKVGRFWMPTRVLATVGGIRGTRGKEAKLDVAFAQYQVNIGLTDEFMDAKIAQGTQPDADPPRRFRHGPGNRP